jgi:hypothetical protein
MPREFARRLLAFEGEAQGDLATEGPAAFRVCEKLREPLSKLMGVDGFRSLFARAQVLAGTEISWLRQVQIKENGALEGLAEREADLEPAAIVEGEVVLVGHLLGLLVVFIGPALTLGLLHDIWPGWTIGS